MSTTKNGSKNASKLSKPADLTIEEGRSIIHLMTAGADDSVFASLMASWPAEKKANGWQFIAEYFRTCANYNPDLEMGKSLARLQMLFNNSVKIQDFKAALSVQKEINKLCRLYDNRTTRSVKGRCR